MPGLWLARDVNDANGGGRRGRGGRWVPAVYACRTAAVRASAAVREGAVSKALCSLLIAR